MIEYSVVGLLYTRTCPLRCRHCIISSSPEVHEKMHPEQARAYISAIPNVSPAVCFTGGEPMLYYNEIVPLIRYAVSLGLDVTMVSGAGWVSQKKLQIARDRLLGLQEAGLRTLCISWDVYHEEYCDPANALFLIETAKELGMSVTVRGVMPAMGTRADIESKLVQINVRYEKVPVIRLGNAAALPSDHFTFATEVERGGCGTVVSPSVEPDGNVYACCGPSRSARRSSPLILGNTNTEDLGTILERGRADPLIDMIHRVGPYGIAQLLRSDRAASTSASDPKFYTGICELCLDLFDDEQQVANLRTRLQRFDTRALLAAATMLQRSLPS